MINPGALIETTWFLLSFSHYIAANDPHDIVCRQTGTLTESELGFAALLPCDPGTGFSDPVTEPTSVDSDDPRVLTLASCHGLSIIDGEPQGDPLDLPLFNVCGPVAVTGDVNRSKIVVDSVMLKCSHLLMIRGYNFVRLAWIL